MTLPKRGMKAVQLAVSVLLLGYLLLRFHYSARALRFTGVAWLLPCVLIAAVLVPALAGLRWRAMLASLGAGYPLWGLVRINFLSIFWGAMLPSSDGFVIIRAWLLMKQVPKKLAIGSVVLEKYLGVLCLFSIALAASLALPGSAATRTLRVVLPVAIALLLGAVLLVKKVPPRDAQPTTLPGKVKGHLRSVAVLLAGARKGPLLRGVLLVLCVQFLSILNVYFVFRLLGHPVPLVSHLCFVPVVQTISLLPFTLSGFGVREGAFVLFYHPLGVPPDVLITISVLNFLLLTGIPAIVGGGLSIGSHIGKPDILQPQRQQEP